MSGRLLNTLLFFALIVTVGLNWVAGSDLSEPNVEFLPEMVHSVPYDAFAHNPNFADGKTLRRPPAGAIARGFMPLPYRALPEDALRAGEELSSPIGAADTTGALERGAFVYSTFCRHCHGAKGLGDGQVSLRGFPPPPSLLAEQARALPDGKIFHALTFGQGNMPSHAAQLSPQDRWNVIGYVRTLQERAPTPPPVEEQP